MNGNTAEGLNTTCVSKMCLKGKSRVGMINTAKQTCQLMMRISNLVSHFELPNGRSFPLNVHTAPFSFRSVFVDKNAARSHCSVFK